jgi:hypothetical protein
MAEPPLKIAATFIAATFIAATSLTATSLTRPIVDPAIFASKTSSNPTEEFDGGQAGRDCLSLVLASPFSPPLRTRRLNPSPSGLSSPITSSVEACPCAQEATSGGGADCLDY